MLYGNISTNGGTIKPSQYITGTIDNNVPFTVPPFKMPTDLPAPQPSPTSITSTEAHHTASRRDAASANLLSSFRSQRKVDH